MSQKLKTLLLGFSFAVSTLSSTNTKTEMEKKIEQQLKNIKHVKYKGTYSVNGYKIGNYPKYNKKLPYSKRPEEFMEVTEKNKDIVIGDHLKLIDFAQHLPESYPKYLALDPKLVVKLETIIADLERKGYNTDGIKVFSGFRGPWYNSKVNGAKYSTHLYGLAADFFVGDVDRDGDEDLDDAKIVYTVIENIDNSNSFLVGGAGVYEANKNNSPFIHVDVRGKYARWGIKFDVKAKGWEESAIPESIDLDEKFDG